ncbi:MAG: hypothetical protein JWN49_49 [Parcubacteria group bacterium]|nr:hypothetical protein [Parcubacteria group bacterium]
MFEDLFSVNNPHRDHLIRFAYFVIIPIALLLCVASAIKLGCGLVWRFMWSRRPEPTI